MPLNVIRTETLLQETLDNAGIKKKHQDSIRHYLALLRARDEATYLHSIRVGIVAYDIGKHCSTITATPKAMLWAGLLHDIGKTLINPKLLKKTTAFTEEDYKSMEPHVEYGWRMLREIHDWTAHIIIRHHRFGSRPYPELPPLPTYLVAKESLINAYGRLLALADYYDALMTRDNAKFGGKLSLQEKRERFLKDNRDQERLILILEKDGVFNFSSLN